MIALDFDNAVFGRAAGPASGLKLFTQIGQRPRIQCNAFDNRYTFAPSPFCFKRHPYDTIVFWN